MNLAAVPALNSIVSGNISDIPSLTGTLSEKQDTANGTMFDAILNTAIENISVTNGYLSDAENEEIKFMLGETESTHDLMVSLQKASTALQYTVAVRDKIMDAYKEIIQMQI